MRDAGGDWVGPKLVECESFQNCSTFLSNTGSEKAQKNTVLIAKRWPSFEQQSLSKYLKTYRWYILWKSLFIFWQEVFCHGSFRSSVWNSLSNKVLVVCLWFWIHLTEKRLQLIIYILNYRSFEIMCDSNTYSFLTSPVTIRLQYSIKWWHVTTSEESTICRIRCM